MLRQESAHLDKEGRPIQNRAEDLGNTKYARGYELLSTWVEQNLDVYKVRVTIPLSSQFLKSIYSLSFDDCSGRSLSTPT